MRILKDLLRDEKEGDSCGDIGIDEEAAAQLDLHWGNSLDGLDPNTKYCSRALEYIRARCVGVAVEGQDVITWLAQLSSLLLLLLLLLPMRFCTKDVRNAPVTTCNKISPPSHPSRNFLHSSFTLNPHLSDKSTAYIDLNIITSTSSSSALASPLTDGHQTVVPANTSSCSRFSFQPKDGVPPVLSSLIHSGHGSPQRAKTRKEAKKGKGPWSA